MVVLVISAHFLREILIGILHREGDIDTRRASSSRTAEAAIAECPPTLVVIGASHFEGAPLVAAVRARLPNVGVVVLAMHEQDEDFPAWADVGISGYLEPDTSTSTLVSTVRRAAAGGVVCPSRLTALLLNRSAHQPNLRAGKAGINALTAREHEIAALLADGLSNKGIALRLNVALPTVKNHVHRVLDKLGVRSRGEAAAHVRRQGEPDCERLAAARASHATRIGGVTPHKGEVRQGMPARSIHCAA
jgi:DNA-binding NarL/FixJ family response regulator